MITFQNIKNPVREEAFGKLSVLPKELIVNIFQFIDLSKYAQNLARINKIFRELTESLLSSSQIQQLFMKTIALNHIESIKRLLPKKCLEPEIINKALISASELGFLEVVTHLLGVRHLNPAAEDSSALRLACQHGHFDIAEKLLKDSRIVNLDPQQMLFAIACSGVNIKIVELLIKDQRVMINLEVAISLADLRGRHEIVSLLETRRANGFSSPFKYCQIENLVEF